MAIKYFIVLIFILEIYCSISYNLKPECTSWIGCVSHYEVNPIIQLRNQLDNQNRISYHGSIDLSYSKAQLIVDEEGLYNDVNELLATWEELSVISKKTTNCYALYNDGSKPMKVSTISSKTNIPASLCPGLNEPGAPTMVLGGFTMHRISGDSINPMIDTKAKINSISIYNGSRILDTCLGLGYTAIEAGKKVGKYGGKVTSIEYDDASIEMCSFNPWSKQLFDQSLPIEILEGDACEIIKSFPNNSFDGIIHDPPARALCRSDLYGLEFYKQLRRVLKRSGQLFHYIGNPSSKESGRLFGGIIERLYEAGFTEVKKVNNAFGVKASGIL